MALWLSSSSFPSFLLLRPPLILILLLKMSDMFLLSVLALCVL